VLELPNHFRGALMMDGSIEAAVNESEDTTFSEMLHGRSGDFRPLRGHDVNMGFVRASAWMRFAIKGTGDAKDLPPQRILLSLIPNMTNVIEVYVAREKPDLDITDFTKFDLGDRAPLLRSSFNGLDNILPLDVPSDATLVVYVRAANFDSSLNLSAAIYSPAGYTERVLISSLIVGLWLGGMVILIVVQSVFFFLDRRSFYGLLALYIFFTASAYFAGLGLSRLFLFPEGGGGNDLFVGTSNWLGLCTGTLCIASILDLRRRFPKLDIFYRVAAAAGVVGVLLVFAGHNHWFTPVAGPLIFAATTIALAVAAMDFRHEKDPESGLKLAAFALLWGGLMLTNAQRYGVVPLPNWVSRSYGATSIVYFILLTGSLAVRLRRAEEASRQANLRAIEVAFAAETLANELVVERTREVEDARQVAEAALRSELEAQKVQVRFMEVISHQYRTPLAVVRSNLDSVKFTLPSDDQANHERLERASRGIARLVEVLEVNLARSVLQGSAFEPTMESISVSALVEGAVSRARELFTAADIRTIPSEDFAAGYISGDREMLTVALINLLDNGVKFSSLGIAKIEVRGTIDGDHIVIEIRDFGIGIPPQELAGIRSLGTRGSNALHLEGTGTGLSLVERIITAHMGNFEVSNARDVGVLATIQLPLIPSRRLGNLIPRG
jgi:signal transduction histidine kinase